MKFKGGLLPFTLAISLVMALFCMAAIMYAYYQNLIWIKINSENKLLLNVKSAFEYISATGLKYLDVDNQTALDLYGDGKDSVVIERGYWGIYDFIHARAQTARDTYEEKALLARSNFTNENLALYISDAEKDPLTMIGNAQINGDAYLPKSGVRAGYINKLGYQGTVLINGRINRSNKELPVFDPELYSKIQHVFYSNIGPEPDERLWLDNEEVSNSFLSPTIQIYSEDPISIENTIKGNVIIRSRIAIVVDSDAYLEDVILIAPRIMINRGFVGNLQAFSQDSIIINHEVQLRYPSVLYAQSHQKSTIHIGAHCLVEGLVLMIDISGEDQDLGGVVTINSGARVTGQVISNSMVQHSGKIAGQLFCHSLIYNSQDSRFINYLVDGEVDTGQLTDTYGSASVFKSDVSNYFILDKLN